MWMRGLDFQARDLLFNHLQYKQKAINVFVQLSLASLGFCAARSDHMQNREGSTKLSADASSISINSMGAIHQVIIYVR